MQDIPITLEEQTRRKAEAKKAAKALKANIAKADRIYKKLRLWRDSQGWWIADILIHKHGNSAPDSLQSAVVHICFKGLNFGKAELRNSLKSILED